MKSNRLVFACLFFVAIGSIFSSNRCANAQEQEKADWQRVPSIESSWNDLLDGINDDSQWQHRKAELKSKFLQLLRDDFKPQRPELNLELHETVNVDGVYERRLVSYQVGEGERAHAYLGVPLQDEANQVMEKGTTFPAIVALHGTFAQGKDRVAGLVDNPQKAYLDHLCRRGYVVIAPDHFVAGERIPPEGAYDTTRFHEAHPEWTAVGKFTFEHSIAIDVLESLDYVDSKRIGAMGHSLGGHGTIFLAAYDDRVAAAAANCAGPCFRHNPKVLDWSRDRWYVYFQHLRPELLAGNAPEIDFHEMMALVAPRPFLDVSAVNDGNPASQRQRVLALMKVMEVYELEQAAENFSFYFHGQGHAVPDVSRSLIYGFFDEQFKLR